MALCGLRFRRRLYPSVTGCTPTTKKPGSRLPPRPRQRKGHAAFVKRSIRRPHSETRSANLHQASSGRQASRSTTAPCAAARSRTYGTPRQWQRRIPHGAAFDRARIGEKEYNRANAALSRSVKRLAAHNLIWTERLDRNDFWQGTAIFLNNFGQPQADALIAADQGIVSHLPMYQEELDRLKTGGYNPTPLAQDSNQE